MIKLIRNVGIVALVGFIISVCIQSTYSQQESSATLEETLRFINVKINDYASKGDLDYDRLEIVGGCNLKLITHRERLSGPYKISDTSFFFSLADIEPTSVKGSFDLPPSDYPGAKGAYGIKMETTGNKGKIRLETTNPGKGGTEINYWDHVDMAITDKEIRDRVVRALTHAVKLCGGKVDPF